MTQITRDNIDKLLDSGQLQVMMLSGKWWTIRRNGATRKWMRSPLRIRVPFRYGFRGQSHISELDFGPSGALRANFRVREDS